MIDFKNLSYWEKKYILEDIDFLIIGGGLVGISTALELRKLHSSAKIVLLERGYLPTGASTKNAGFTCFGSVSEIVDDLHSTDPQTVWDTVYERYSGLQLLLERFPPEQIQYEQCGSFDLYCQSDQNCLEENNNYLDSINHELFKITGTKNCNSWVANTDIRFGFKGTIGGFFNQLEGQIDTSKLLDASYNLLQNNAIRMLFGIHVLALDLNAAKPEVETNFGKNSANKIALTTNAFTTSLLPHLEIKTARAQVLITKPIQNLKLNSTFHYDKGYTYFRSIDNRILLGGGRNLAFDEENTSDFENTSTIKNYLSNLLSSVICPDTSVEIDYFWSGIMGLGPVKKPLIQSINANAAIGVRMGGMGIAIGSNVGKKLAQLLSKS